MALTGDQVFKEFLNYRPKKVLEIGGKSDGQHFQIMKRQGIHVQTIDRIPPADIVADYMDIEFEPQEAIWCSHVLEHQRNPGLFLDKIVRELSDDGLLAITVPPASPQLKGGHVTIWTEAILIYQLVLSGLDCVKAKIWRYGYNISCLLKKRPIQLGPLTYSKADLETIRRYIPEKI